MKHIVLSKHLWEENFIRKLNEIEGHTFIDWRRIELETYARINPRYIFVPHWSKIIPETVYGKYETVVFHIGDLPKGRGGTPVQNLIAQGTKVSKVCAFKCVEGLDAGPIYCRRDITLEGTARDIYRRGFLLMCDMIREIVEGDITPVEQSGEPTVFQRRVPSESELPTQYNQERIYDHIRMVDADGYPPAFVDHGDLRIEFSDAKCDGSKVVAKATIGRKL